MTAADRIYSAFCVIAVVVPAFIPYIQMVGGWISTPWRSIGRI